MEKGDLRSRFKKYELIASWVVITLFTAIFLFPFFLLFFGFIQFDQSLMLKLVSIQALLGVIITYLLFKCFFPKVHEKQTENRIVASINPKTLEQTLKDTDQLVYDYNLDTNTINWYGAVEKFTGYHPSDFLKNELSWLDLIHLEDRPQVKIALEKAIKEKRLFNETYRLKRKDGGAISVNDRATVHLNEHTGDLHLNGVIIDMTDMEYVKYIAESSQEKIDRLFEHMSDGFALLRAEMNQVGTVNDFTLVEVNLAMEEFIPSAEEQVGAKLFDVLPKLEKDSIHWKLILIDTALSGNEFQEVVYSEALNKWIRLHAFSPQDEYVALILSDITNEKENSLKLEESEEQFRGAFETSAVGMALVAIDGTFLQANVALSTMLGYTIEELEKKTWQSITHPHELKNNEHYVKQLLQGKSDSFHMEKRYLKKDGEYLWVLISVSLTKYKENGKPKYLVTQVQNIDERKLREEKLQELNELKNKFIRVVSHQLRTPLTTIRWNLESLLSGDLGKLNKSQHEALVSSSEAGRATIDRVADMMLALDIEQENVQLSEKQVKLDELWKQVPADLEPLIELKQMKVVFKQPKKQLPELIVDEDKILFVMKQFVKNALMYSPEKKTISVTLSSKSNELRFTVKDQGVGIPKTEQGRIFERFFRATNAFEMETDHSGLGLYIAKHFIEAHGGEIGFISKEKKGSEFWFTLPA